MNPGKHNSTTLTNEFPGAIERLVNQKFLFGHEKQITFGTERNVHLDIV